MSLVGGRSWTRVSFGVGALVFGLEALAGYVLLGTQSAEDRVRWASIHAALGVAALIPWTAFVAGLAGAERPRPSARARAVMALGGAALGAPALAVGLTPSFATADVQGPFYAIQLLPMGRYATVAQMLGAVVVLAGLEATLRASSGGARWRIKYLILGLGGIFLIRFYLLSQMLMFQVLMGAYVTTGAVTLAVGNLAMAVALVRSRLHDSSFTVSRRLVYRSVIVGVLGAYLLAAGVLAWLLN